MNKMIKLTGIIALLVVIGFGMLACGDDTESDPNNPSNPSNPSTVWVDPCTQTTQLTGGTVLNPPVGGNNNLLNSPYGYEVFLYDENADLTKNKMTWYGLNQGGGGAFKVDWNGYILARLGYYWGNGGKYTQYKNIYADYNYKRSANNTCPNGGVIGVYGWSRNPSASKPVEKLIEYYICDDWFIDGQYGPNNIYQTYTKTEIANRGETLNSNLGPYTENGNNVTFGKELGSFEVDGATYKLYVTTRVKEGCIDNPPNYEGTFIQLYSIRQGRRTSGTISVTEHFKAWSKYYELGNLYEAKFKVEAMNFTGTPVAGYIDLSYMYMSMEDNPRPANKICSGNCNSGGGDEPSQDLVVNNPSLTDVWTENGTLAADASGYFSLTTADGDLLAYTFPTGWNNYSKIEISYTTEIISQSGEANKIAVKRLKSGAMYDFVAGSNYGELTSGNSYPWVNGSGIMSGESYNVNQFDGCIGFQFAAQNGNTYKIKFTKIRFHN